MAVRQPLHSLYRAAVSALFSLVVLLIMHCKVTCCSIVSANKEGRKEPNLPTSKVLACPVRMLRIRMTGDWESRTNQPTQAYLENGR